MMNLVRMAIRNLLRQYRRTIFSMISIIVGVTIVIAGRGFTGGIIENMIRSQIDGVGGHVLATPMDYPTLGLRHPVDHLITVNDETKSWLDEHSKVWTARLVFAPRAVVGGDSTRVRAIGVDPATDEGVFLRTDWHIDGKMPDTPAEGVLIGKDVARVFKLKPGDAMVLEGRTAGGALNAISVPVAGVLTSGMPMIDAVSVFMVRDLATSFLQSGDGVSHVAMRLANRNDAGEIAAELAPLLGDQAQVSDWYTDTRELVASQDLRTKMFDIMALAMFAIAATGIANTILMAAYERIREIGTMRAMGLTRGGVVSMFMLEGLFLGIVGAALGGLLGAWITWHYAEVGIDLGALVSEDDAAGTYAAIPMTLVIHMAFTPAIIALASGMGVLAAVISSAYPAYIASNLVPAEAVRAE